MVTEIILLVVSQLLFGFARTLNVRYTAQDRVIPALITSTVVKLAWLGSSAVGIKSAMDLVEDFSDINGWLILTIFIISGITGDRIAFSFKVKSRT